MCKRRLIYAIRILLYRATGNPPRSRWPILITAGLRLWQLDRLPPGLFFDEAFNGVDARAVLAGQNPAALLSRQ